MQLVKKFIEYYKPHKKLFFLDIFCAFLLSGIDLVFPSISRYILNNVIPDKNIDLLIKLIIFSLGLFILRSILQYIIHYWGHVVGVRIEADMRNKIFSHIQSLDTKFFDNNKTGNIMSRVINDLRDVTELAHHGPEDLFISTVMFIGSFLILFNIEWHLTLIVFLFIPVMLYFATKQRKTMRNAFRTVRKKIALVNSNLENSISGIRESKTYTNEEIEYDKFLDGNDQFKSSREMAYKSMATFFTGINFFQKVLNLAVIGFGGYFIYRKFMTVGDLLAFTMYINLFMQPIRRLTQFTQQFQLGMSGFERFTDLIEREPEIIDKKDAKEFKTFDDKIEYKNVSFSYDHGEEVLTNINFEIDKGKTLALVGPSGGGKTTLCNLLPRFYDINSGKIEIDNINIKDYKIKSLRENIGFVQQDVFIFTGTVRENILYGNPNASEKEMIKASKNANIHNFIMSLENGYDTDIGEKGVKLSGGQKQRVSIARVFLKNPPILILDEATSALDNETELKIQKSLDQLSKGRTTIVIAHRLSTIKNADEIIVITDNGIEEKGTHDKLIKNDKLYSKLYKAQFKGFIPDEILN
ncbi:MAG: ABC transporter ATP-binding protein [Bacillota bacterium]